MPKPKTVMRPAHQFRLLALAIFVVLWLWLPEALEAIWILAKVIFLLIASLVISAYVLSFIHERFFEDD